MGHCHNIQPNFTGSQKEKYISCSLILMDPLAQDTDMKERVSLSPEEDSSQNASSCRHFSAVISKVLRDHDLVFINKIQLKLLIG